MLLPVRGVYHNIDKISLQSPVSLKTATSRWSFSVSRPILPEDSMLSTNPSRVSVSSEPNHLGITEINDKSVWTISVVILDARSLRRSILFSLLTVLI